MKSLRDKFDIIIISAFIISSIIVGIFVEYFMGFFVFVISSCPIGKASFSILHRHSKLPKFSVKTWKKSVFVCAAFFGITVSMGLVFSEYLPKEIFMILLACAGMIFCGTHYHYEGIKKLEEKSQ